MKIPGLSALIQIELTSLLLRVRFPRLAAGRDFASFSIEIRPTHPVRFAAQAAIPATFVRFKTRSAVLGNAPGTTEHHHVF